MLWLDYIYVIMFFIAVIRIREGRNILKHEAYSFMRRIYNGLIPQTEKVEIRGPMTRPLGYHHIISGFAIFPVFSIPLFFPIVDVGALFIIWIIIDIFIYSLIRKISSDRYFRVHNESSN